MGYSELIKQKEVAVVDPVELGKSAITASEKSKKREKIYTFLRLKQYC